MRPWLRACVLFAGLGVSAPGHAGPLPGVWLLEGEDGEADRRRLVVGGTLQEPPGSPEQTCLSWSWRDPKPDVELYPDAAAGTFLETHAAWSFDADPVGVDAGNPVGEDAGDAVGEGAGDPAGEDAGNPVAEGAGNPVAEDAGNPVAEDAGNPVDEEPCRPAGALPRLGIGPSRELWLLAPAGTAAVVMPWADLLDAVEAAWRQSTSAPLTEQTAGTLGGCAIRSRPVPAEVRLDRWSPVELPRRAGEAPEDAGADRLLRSRRFQWWIEPPADGGSCAAQSRGVLRLFPVPAKAAEATPGGDAGDPPSDDLMTIAGVEWLRPGSFDLEADEWSPRLRALKPAEASGASEIQEIAVPAAEPPMALWQWWALGAGAVTALAALVALSARRRRRAEATLAADARDELRRLVEAAVDRRLRALGAVAPAPEVAGAEPPEVAGAEPPQVAAAKPPEVAGAEASSEAHERRLAEVAGELREQLRDESAALADALRRSLRQEAQSLSEGLRQDVEAETSPQRRLRLEIRSLPDGERRPLTASLEAAGRLGRWIERLWPALEAAAEHDVESIARRLPEPAAAEWREAERILRAFSRIDAVALRRLAGDGDAPAAEAAVLENAGLLGNERPVAERFKRFLEPFDHLGRLGEVTLALQYLLEAYPVEQLPRERRPVLRRELSDAQRDGGLEDDFHALVSAVAAGIGLRYAPVPYYRSRTGDADFAFIRQQLSPISLSERVGFEATADKEVIVRLERPFFFQLETGIYYAGHACVAR